MLLALAGLCGCGPGASEQRRNDYIAAHPETNGTTSSLIQNGRVAPGMTKDQVIAAWGSPPSGCKTFQTNYQTIWDYCHHPGRTLVIFDQSGRRFQRSDALTKSRPRYGPGAAGAGAGYGRPSGTGPLATSTGTAGFAISTFNGKRPLLATGTVPSGPHPAT